jgi:hypothetical protein
MDYLTAIDEWAYGSPDLFGASGVESSLKQQCNCYHDDSYCDFLPV